ncbi:hypothetical protein FRACA_1360002 [Frankia canadensis]|uniref:Uncharacterized protein n=1 Tax=Frankia canadensis TaxID=1836972 RepID=A0A2I2KKZ9_9ACTN|nr:hypothetical protein FRACA_1360002 [Frankia canadensis]SOU53614.1 hypothetical protein FRACA_1360002 [Frankia canadensis]
MAKGRGVPAALVVRRVMLARVTRFARTGRAGRLVRAAPVRACRWLWGTALIARRAAVAATQ